MKKATILAFLVAVFIIFPQHTSVLPPAFFFLQETVMATAYTPVEMKCKATRCITASGKPAKIGYIAVSRDLEAKGIRFGDVVHISGAGFFKVQDRMNKRKKKSVDIYMDSYPSAIKFGRKKTTLLVMREGEANLK